MKDDIYTQNVGGLKLPKLKGEVTVKLFNAETGELEQEAHGENMVSNAMKDIFASNYFGLLDYNYLMPLSTEIFGGVLCFRDTLPANAKKYYPPTTDVNPVVAHAGQSLEGYGDDPKRGLPNEEASVYLEKGRRNVWDFTPTQGNGTFSALALTHKDTGDFWFYNDSFQPVKLSDYAGGVSPSDVFTTEYPQVFHPAIRKGYCFHRTGSSELTIFEFKRFGAIEKVGLNQQKLISPSSNALITASHVITGLSVDPNKCRIIYDPSLRVAGADEYDSLETYVQNDIVTYKNVAYKCTAETTGDFDPTKWEVLSGYTWLVYVNGTTLKTIKINMSDYSFTEASHTLSGISMREFISAKDPYTQLTDIDDDNNLYIQGNTITTAYRIKMLDNLVPNNVYTIEKSNRDCRTIIGFGNFGISIGTGQGFILEGNNSHDVAIPEALDGTDWATRWYNHFRPETNRSPVAYSTGEVRWANNACAPRTLLNKLFLSTIYNLDQPISKSATQTMQITYQITEVED